MAIAETLGTDFRTFFFHLFVRSKPTLLHWDVLCEHSQYYMSLIQAFKNIKWSFWYPTAQILCYIFTCTSSRKHISPEVEKGLPL